jgi:hypothetical protein
MGYLEQTAVSGSDRTVWEEARSRMIDLLRAEEMLESAGKAMEQGAMDREVIRKFISCDMEVE